jgi:hypothetical protein
MGKQKRTNKKDLAVEYWHGGPAGRAVGDLLIPGTEAPGISHGVDEMTPEIFAQQRPDFVYITIDRNLALDYSILNAKLGPAALYRVKPRGPLQPDPDYPSGISHRCRAAVVLAVESDVITAETPDTGAHLGYSTWDDGSPLYDSDGYPLPNKIHQSSGVKPSHLRGLGYGADFDAIANLCTRTMHDLHSKDGNPRQLRSSSSRDSFGF